MTFHPRTENCSEIAQAMSDQMLLANEIKSNTNLVLMVPDRLSSRPDPLITSTKEYHNAVKRYDWRHGGQYPQRIDVLVHK